MLICLLTFASGRHRSTDVKMRPSFFCLLLLLASRGFDFAHLHVRIVDFGVIGSHRTSYHKMPAMADGGSSDSGEPVLRSTRCLCLCLRHDAAPRLAMLGGIVRCRRPDVLWRGRWRVRWPAGGRSSPPPPNKATVGSKRWIHSFVCCGVRLAGFGWECVY